MEPLEFRPRRVSSRGITLCNGWAMKTYCVTVREEPPPSGLIEASERLAATILPEADAGYGFLVIHQARPACFVGVHWWATRVDLFQRYFRAEHDAPGHLVAVSTPSIGCVWELAIVAHERDAWVQHTLGPAARTDAYLDSWHTSTRAAPLASKAALGT